MQTPKYPPLSPQDLKVAISTESKEFEHALRWLEDHLPPGFLDEVDGKTRIIIARNLMSFALQDRFMPIHFKHKIIVLCMDAPDADLKILKECQDIGIKYYRAFVSNEPPPGEKSGNLRIALVYFRDGDHGEKLDLKRIDELFALVHKKNKEVSKEEFESILHQLTARFVRAMNDERLVTALDMFFRAKTRNQCQYEVRENKEAPSLQIVMAWRNVPKAGFHYLLAKMIHRHGLALQKVVAADINNILVLSLGLHGIDGKTVKETTDIGDFLRELCLLKFENEDEIGKYFPGNEGHLVRNMASFVHQTLLYTDPNLYSYAHVAEGLYRHPELTRQLTHLFGTKFEQGDLELYKTLKKEFLAALDKIDTGQAINDARRRTILTQTLSFIDHTLKTNFYCHNKSAFSFRLDPKYLDREKFPEPPFGIFFIRGLYFLGFNIRFRDLARGGVRTVMPERMEQYFNERNNIFSEGYNLALTQQKKNKDIPEGGAKTAILLKPMDVFAREEMIFKREMEANGIDPKVQDEKLKIYRRDHRLEFLYSSQRAFISALVTLVNCDEDGALRNKSVIDYYKRPEYIYLGPDENMSNEMILWIANYAVARNYKPGRSFMSSKPGAGINHKEYGVTSYGVNVYMHETLLALGIDPEKQTFTVKISGGPDGDVAGNQLLNLHRFYPKTAKLLALTDGSGTIYEPNGLDLSEMAKLFEEGLPIRNYPSEKLSEKGFLLDLRTKKGEETLCYRNKKQEWLSSNEANHLFRTNVHQVKTDMFIPAGGRPKTLNDNNYTEYLDTNGKPTSKAIVEGANLYLTPGARRALEKLGVLIMKDSSCNKGGVICSSFEVLAGLTMTEEEFLNNKTTYVKEVLEIIRQAAYNEARLLLDTHKKTGQFLTDISEKISERINLYKDLLLEKLQLTEALNRYLIAYCPPILQTKFKDRILALPEIHKKAIIACYLGAHTVYKHGLDRIYSIEELIK